MEAWSWNFTLYPCAFPSLWCFAFDCKVWRIITAAVKAPSQAPQLRITILLSVHFSSVPPPKAVLSSSRFGPPATLISLPKYTVPLWDSGPVSVSSLKHTYTLNFFLPSPSLKSIESPRKYWQLEATTRWSDSRKPLIMITSSYFFPFPLFHFPLFPLSCAWSTSPLTWSWFINQHVHVIPATEESSRPLITSFPFLMPQNIHCCCLFFTIVWDLFTLTTNLQNWWSMEEQEVVSYSTCAWHVHHRLHLQRACKLT